MSQFDVYIYGMTVLSTIHKLKADFPPADTYQEIEQTFIMPDGEASNFAVVLRNLGVSTILDGCYLGLETMEAVPSYLEARGIDCSKMTTLDDFSGWRDMVLCDGKSRTVFGWFIEYLFGERKLWTNPCEESIQQAKCVALDPFFRETSARAAELCVRHQTDYVTIDAHWDSQMAKHARALVCSHEFVNHEYPDENKVDLLGQYLSVCQGLVIFTLGGREILYASPETSLDSLQPYEIEVVDTLAAGDTFRAGIVYGILQDMSDRDVVRFAAACSGVACTRFPSVHEPPTLIEIEALINA